MITQTDLTEVYKLFVMGMSVGSLLGGIPFIIGFTVNSLLKLMRS